MASSLARRRRFPSRSCEQLRGGLGQPIGVVIEQRNNLVAVATADVELLVDLAFDTGHVGVHAEVVFTLVDGVDVAADTDGNLCVEPGLATGFASGVVKIACLRSILHPENAVGDELFVRRVVLRRPRDP